MASKLVALLRADTRAPQVGEGGHRPPLAPPLNQASNRPPAVHGGPRARELAPIRGLN